VGEGIAQIIFETLTARPLKTYADKHNGSAGKYMDQTGVTMPIVL
jgi:deoxycytidine triphosphate deaminase